MTERKTCGELMREIARADVEPGVYSVTVVASDHSSVFKCNISFRTYDDEAVRYLSTDGGTPEEALIRALDNLMKLYSPCPHCGRKGAAPEPPA